MSLKSKSWSVYQNKFNMPNDLEQLLDAYFIEVPPYHTIVDFIYSVDWIRQRICYQKNMVEYLGYSFLPDRLNWLQDLMHPDEYRMAIRLIRQIEAFVKLHGKEASNHLFVLSHSLKKSNGDYIKVLRYINPYLIDENNNLLIYNCICQDITSYYCREGVSFDVKPLSEATMTQQKVIEYFQGIAAREEPHLSEREREVLKVFSSIDNAHTAAQILGISERTLATHLRNMRRKLGPYRRTLDIVLIAKEKGWI